MTNIILVREHDRRNNKSQWVPLGTTPSRYSAARLFRTAIAAGSWSAVIWLTGDNEEPLFVSGCYTETGLPFAVLCVQARSKEPSLAAAINAALAQATAVEVRYHAPCDG